MTNSYCTRTFAPCVVYSILFLGPKYTPFTYGECSPKVCSQFLEATDFFVSYYCLITFIGY